MLAVDDMKRAGAVVVESGAGELDEIKRAQSVGTCGGFKSRASTAGWPHMETAFR